MNKIEIKKDLYKSKNMAEFSHYMSGNLYYNVMLSSGFYQFPIATVEEGPVSVRSESIHISTRESATVVEHTKILSTDLGTTAFHDKIRGSELIRWIDKAIDNGTFIKIS